MTRVQRALQLVNEAFAGLTDKAGAPMLAHLHYVANGVAHLGEDYYISGLLHDLLELENPRYTERLVRELFGDVVADAVVLLRRPPGMPYRAYIRALKRNAIARAVKLVDLRHNMDLSRFAGNTGLHGGLMGRYRVAVADLLAP